MYDFTILEIMSEEFIGKTFKITSFYKRIFYFFSLFTIQSFNSNASICHVAIWNPTTYKQF